MNRNLVLATALGLCFWLSAEVLAGGPTLTTSSRRAGGARVGIISSTTIQHHGRHPHYRTRRHEFHRHNYYSHYSPYNNSYYYRRHDPRSIIIITPSTYYRSHAPVTVVTREPFYCHVHHVGFVSRVGFLDHISGAHRIPLETADTICTDDNTSCVIEGY